MEYIIGFAVVTFIASLVVAYSIIHLTQRISQSFLQAGGEKGSKKKRIVFILALGLLIWILILVFTISGLEMH